MRKPTFFGLLIVFVMAPFCTVAYYKWTHDKSAVHQQIAASVFGKRNKVCFRENGGQMTDIAGNPVPFVFFKAELPEIDIYITERGFTFVHLKREEEPGHNIEQSDERDKIHVEYERFDVELKGASILKQNILREGASGHYFNFLRADGNISNVRDFEKITFLNVYPGVDWAIHCSAEGGFKYDFIVHAGADPGTIQMLYNTPNSLEINNEISVATRLGVHRELAPVSYYESSQRTVKSNFRYISSSYLDGRHYTLVGFDFQEKINKEETFIIDPQVTWSTFYGGSGVEGTYSLDSDSAGNIFACGYTFSTNFPLQNSGSYFLGNLGGSFIVKFNNTGVLLWATHFPVNDATSLVVDKSGNVFITGSGPLSNFPLLNSGTFFQGTTGGSTDAFITKFDNNGSLLWSTLYGGGGNDMSRSIACDTAGNIVISGLTTSNNFPVQNSGGYFQNTLIGIQSGFILKFDNLGSRLWATYYPGIDGRCVATDLVGNVFATGASTSLTPLLNPGGSSYFQSVNSGTIDAYILKFDNVGTRLWATFYGGSGYDYGTSLICDNIGNLFVMGTTTSTDFPVQNAGTFFQPTIASTLTNVSDIFVLKFSNNGTRLFGTYFGGNGYDNVASWDNMAVDSCGNLHFSFVTTSSNLPVVPACEGGHLDNKLDGTSDLFLVRFSNSGDFLWGTYFGGDGADFRSAIGIDRSNSLFITGEWNGANSLSSYPLVIPGSPTYYSNPVAGDEVFFAKMKIGLSGVQTFSYDTICTGQGTKYPVHSAGYIPNGHFQSSPGLSINTADGAITPSLSTPGTYTVFYSLNSATCSCMQPISFTLSTVVNVKPSPTIAVTGTTNICSGSTVTLAASAAGSYTWNNQSNGQTISDTPSASTVYVVSTTGTNGCIGSAYHPLIVHPLPAITVAGKDTICQNTVEIYTASGAATYSWTGGANGATAAISSAAASFYTVEGTDLNGCKGYKTFSVVVIPGPLLTISPSKTVCAGERIVLSVNGAAGYTWTGGGHFANQPFIVTTTSVYSAVGQSTNGCTSTASVEITANKCLGVNEEDQEALMVFPNPSKGSVTISAKTEMNLKLVDDRGRIILGINLVSENNFTVSVRNIAKGMYFLVSDVDSSRLRKKVIID